MRLNERFCYWCCRRVLQLEKEILVVSMYIAEEEFKVRGNRMSTREVG